VAAHVLHLIAMSLGVSASFNRKFELVSGWSVLRIVLPSAWDPSVHEAAFDILLGRVVEKAHTASTTVVCAYVVPAIFAALHRGLDTISRQPKVTDNTDVESTVAGEIYDLLISTW
jgi:hypothetical protein